MRAEYAKDPAARAFFKKHPELYTWECESDAVAQEGRTSTPRAPSEDEVVARREVELDARYVGGRPGELLAAWLAGLSSGDIARAAGGRAHRDRDRVNSTLVKARRQGKSRRAKGALPVLRSGETGAPAQDPTAVRLDYKGRRIIVVRRWVLLEAGRIVPEEAQDLVDAAAALGAVLELGNEDKAA